MFHSGGYKQIVNFRLVHTSIFIQFCSDVHMINLHIKHPPKQVINFTE